jgi:hypothetical protein
VEQVKELELVITSRSRKLSASPSWLKSSDGPIGSFGDVVNRVSLTTAAVKLA